MDGMDYFGDQGSFYGSDPYVVDPGLGGLDPNMDYSQIGYMNMLPWEQAQYNMAALGGGGTLPGGGGQPNIWNEFNDPTGGGSTNYAQLLQSLLGLGTAALGKSLGGAGNQGYGTKQKGVTQQATPLDAISKAMVGNQMTLAPYLGTPGMTPIQQGYYGDIVANMGTQNPTQIWNSIMANIPNTQRAIQASLMNQLNTVAPNLTSYGTGIQGIAQNVANADVAMRQLYNQYAAQEGQVLPGEASAFTSLLGLPKTMSQSDVMNILMPYYAQLIAEEQPGRMTTGANTGTGNVQATPPSLLASLLSGLGVGLTNPNNASLFQMLGIG